MGGRNNVEKKLWLFFTLNAEGKISIEVRLNLLENMEQKRVICSSKQTQAMVAAIHLYNSQFVPTCIEVLTLLMSGFSTTLLSKFLQDRKPIFVHKITTETLPVHNIYCAMKGQSATVCSCCT